MADEPQTRVEDAEDAAEDTSAEEDAPAAEDALAEDAPTTASGEAAVPTDPEAADEPAEGDDAVEDPSEEEGVQDVVTADELEEEEEAAAEAEEVEVDEAEEAEQEDEEEEEEEAEAAADEVEEEEEDEEEEDEDEPEAAGEEEEEEAEEPEAAAEDEEEEEEEPAPEEEEEEEEEPEPEPAAEEEEEPAEPEHVVEGTWYAIQTYSGHENKVQKLIQRRIDDEPGESAAEKEIREVLVPTQEVVEIRNGKRVTVTKRLYPGYVLVNMELNDRTMHTINNIQGVIKFVGAGTHPQPLRDEEIRKILGIETGVEKDEEEEEVPFHAGQVVEVTQGPFSDFSGTVQEVYADKGKAKVEVSLFGRPTSVELDFTQLKGY